MDVINWFNRAKKTQNKTLQKRMQQRGETVVFGKGNVFLKLFLSCCVSRRKQKLKMFNDSKVRISWILFCFCRFFVFWWRFGEFQGHHWIPRQSFYQSDVSLQFFIFDLAVTSDDLEKVTIGFPVKFPIKMMCDIIWFVSNKSHDRLALTVTAWPWRSHI